MRVGGWPAVVAQWQSTGGSSQRCPGFVLVVFGLGMRLSDIRVKNFRVKAKFRLRA